MKKGVYTIAEVCDLLSINKRTLATLRHRGQGPKYFRVGPRSPRYRREDLEAWIGGPLPGLGGSGDAVAGARVEGGNGGG